MTRSTAHENDRSSGYGAPLLYGLVLTLVILAAYFMPRSGADVAVLVSPFASRAAAANAVARADGLIVDTGRWPFIVLARPSATDAATFPARLYKSGALIVFSPGIMAGCLKKD
ncbi:MAG: hypothetical protein QM647_13370 [Asticcacaulis sp.]|uniref:hypothetical protein n=1 Tax=Asticcacaulis sp. TaxID=1872648 RepID=UPI0039E32873